MTSPPRQQAPLGRRFVAGLLNGVAGVTAVAAVGGLVGLAVFRGGPLRRRLADGQPIAIWSKRFWETYGRWSKRHRSALFVWKLLSEIQGRQRLSPGAQLLGLRRVDARTGGPVTVRSAVVRFCAFRLWWASSQLVLQPLQQRARERQEAVAPELKRIQEKYRGDKAAQQEAMMAAYKEAGVSGASCWLSLLPIVVPAVSALVPPGHRSVFDRLAGTVVVIDRGPRRSRRRTVTDVPAKPTSD